MLERPKLKTLETTVYKDFELYKQTNKAKLITSKEYKSKLSIMFDLMGRKTVEEVTSSD